MLKRIGGPSVSGNRALKNGSLDERFHERSDSNMIGKWNLEWSAHQSAQKMGAWMSAPMSALTQTRLENGIWNGALIRALKNGILDERSHEPSDSNMIENWNLEERSHEIWCQRQQVPDARRDRLIATSTSSILHWVRSAILTTQRCNHLEKHCGTIVTS